MGDMGDVFRDMKEYKRMLRNRFGIECPKCKLDRPRANPTILLPQQQCYDGYKDTRPRLTQEQKNG